MSVEIKYISKEDAQRLTKMIMREYAVALKELAKK